MRLAGYVRVSTEEQASQGVSHEAQEERVRTYCRLHGYDLELVVRDNGVSARTVRKRPRLLALLAALKKKKFDGIVITKLDRLSRSTRDVLDLVDASGREGWCVHAIDERLDTSSPSGRFVVTVLAGLAQLEREQISERTKAALAHKRRKGERISGWAPFGYAFEGDRVVEVEEEQRLLRVIAGMKPTAAAQALNALGATTRAGTPWTRQAVWRVSQTARRMGA